MDGSRLGVNRAEMSHMPHRRSGEFFGAIGAAAVACALAACSPPLAPEGPAPASLAKADPIIVSVQPAPKGVRVVARIDQPDLAGDAIRTATRAVRQIARAVQNKASDLPPDAKVITFDLYGVDVDKFGKRTPGRLFETDFYIDDMRDLDLKQKGPAAVMDTAIDLRIDKAGIDPINAWCMRYPHVGGNYCEMAGD
jgi:hypothetical protein